MLPLALNSPRAETRKKFAGEVTPWSLLGSMDHTKLWRRRRVNHQENWKLIAKTKIANFVNPSTENYYLNTDWPGIDYHQFIVRTKLIQIQYHHHHLQVSCDVRTKGSVQSAHPQQTFWRNFKLLTGFMRQVTLVTVRKMLTMPFPHFTNYRISLKIFTTTFQIFRDNDNIDQQYREICFMNNNYSPIINQFH